VEEARRTRIEKMRNEKKGKGKGKKERPYLTEPAAHSDGQS